MHHSPLDRMLNQNTQHLRIPSPIGPYLDKMSRQEDFHSDRMLRQEGPFLHRMSRQRDIILGRALSQRR